MKKFLIIGNMNALKYKEVFPLIKEDRVWLGVTSFNCGMYFEVPESYEYAETYKFDKIRDGKRVMRVSSVCWFTNLEHRKPHVPMDFYRKYRAEDYPKYDGQDVIEVGKFADVPMDYDGVMGVPITFLNKYCPEQFEIVGEANHGCDNEYDLFVPRLGGVIMYPRILIRFRR